MRRLLFPGIFLFSIWACSSSDDSSTGSDVTADDGAAGGAVTMDASANTMPMIEAAAPADHSVANTSDTGAAASDAKAPSDAPKVMEQVDASMPCIKYCSCMAMNCAEQVFPTGCLVECSRQSNWDLECRQNMCNLAPIQTMNDHCTHAFGKGQCTNQ